MLFFNVQCRAAFSNRPCSIDRVWRLGLETSLETHFCESLSRRFRVRLPDVRQALSLNLLSKLAMSLILEKHFVVLEYFQASLKVRKQL